METLKFKLIFLTLALISLNLGSLQFSVLSCLVGFFFS